MTMAEYINLDNALERLLFSMCGTGYQYEAMHAISSMPTVDIVFCKDCKHKFTEYDGSFTCNVFSNSYGLPYRINPNDFCSYGERRTK